MNHPASLPVPYVAPPSKRSSENLYLGFQTTFCLIKSLQLLPDGNQQ
ncbi:hypothetical protein HMPREF9418_0213 [Neisseria macacae ATCC 33926]|uniref:Uncharacterized protein n=1 Tax=Neisseria macacae ATCC 33926 TaxID=997348 RepID=A0AA36XLS2_9NEIS|nr:hypothetical protein HMPREF9418_0213 [Neisseria macacae ATCC 33926]